MINTLVLFALGLSTSLLLSKASFSVDNANFNIKTSAKVDFDKKFSRSNKIFDEKNVKDELSNFFNGHFHPLTKSNFKEESQKKSTMTLSSFLLRDGHLYYTEDGNPVSPIVSGGAQETLYASTPVFIKKYSGFEEAGNINANAACQLRNLTIPGPISLLGSGVHGFCQMWFTYTSNDSQNSSITFMFSVSGNSVIDLLTTLSGGDDKSKSFRSIASDGVYFGKTYDVRIGVVPSTPDGPKVNFYVSEVQQSKKSYDLDYFGERSLSSKKNSPFSITITSNGGDEEVYLTGGEQLSCAQAGATLYINQPVYDQNGKFIAMVLVQAHEDVVEYGCGRRKLISNSLHVAEGIFSFILNDKSASSILFVVASELSSSSNYKAISFAATGVFAGKKFELVITAAQNQATITELKYSKLSSMALMENAANSDSFQLTSAPITFSVTHSPSTDGNQISVTPGWQLYPSTNSPNSVFDQFTFRDVSEISGEGNIQTLAACQYDFVRNYSAVCQMLITYHQNDSQNSSITFVTSTNIYAYIDYGFDVFIGIPSFVKVVRSLSSTGLFYGKTFNIEYALDNYGNVTMAFSEIFTTPTNKPTRQPTIKPTKKPSSKKSNDKQSLSLNSKSTGSEASVGAIVGIAVGAFFLIGLLVGVYIWYMKKIQAKNAPVSLEDNM